MNFRGHFIFVVVAMGSTAQVHAQQERHGTINVVLANRNGAVVVTDSRLSNSSGIAGSGQKLFVLDDRTACAIAGFYDNPGAQLYDPTAKAKLEPLDVSVPGVMLNFTNAGKTSGDKSVSSHLKEIVEIYLFALQLSANLNWNPAYPAPSEAILTVVGYQDNRLHLSGVKLKPYHIGRVWKYLPTEQIDTVLGDGFLSRVEGITAVADAVTKNPKLYAKEPLLKDFAAAITDNGANLAVDQLEEMADDLETETASHFSRVVGGARQTAVFANGKLTYKGPEWEKPTLSATQGLVIFERDSVSYSSLNGFNVPRTAKGAVFFEGNFDHVSQKIDGIAFVSSSIESSTLTYNGERPTSLGGSNLISNSMLIVGRAVSVDDPFLKRVQLDFPDLKIVRNE